MKADLLDRFLDYSKANNLFFPEDQLVIAISGGGDSVSLVDLLSRLGQRMILAHCNFKLRGDESDEDEAFVRKIAVIYDLSLDVKEFQTVEYASRKGVSIEMAARELRYAWFEEVRAKTGSRAIAVAHHSDDSMETLIINLIRGTGIRGLSGIHPQQGKIIRPMLFTNRNEISDYLASRNIEYRHDSSNLDSKHVRNRIRNVVIPEFEKINPSVRQTISKEQLYFTQAAGIFEEYIQQKKEFLTHTDEEYLKIDKGLLKEEKYPETLLFEILKPFGFHGRQISRILSSTEGNPGKIFTSSTHTLLVDRQYLLVGIRQSANNERYYLDPALPDEDLPLNIQCRVFANETFQPYGDPYTACLDYSLLDLPLILRKWEAGDFFYPLGMDHSKKLSDFFIDQKVSRDHKNRTWILASGEKIVWIVGQRIDNRFRVTEKSREILEIKIVNVAEDFHARG